MPVPKRQQQTSDARLSRSDAHRSLDAAVTYALAPTLASHVPAPHAGDRYRRERPAERIDKEHARTSRRRKGALEGLDVVPQAVLGDGRVGNDHHGLLRGIFSGLSPGQHGVGWIDGEAVVAFGPPLKEPVSGDVPDDALRAVGEVDGVRGKTEQGHGPVVTPDSAGSLDEHVLDGGGWRVRHWISLQVSRP